MNDITDTGPNSIDADLVNNGIPFKKVNFNVNVESQYNPVRIHPEITQRGLISLSTYNPNPNVYNCFSSDSEVTISTPYELPPNFIQTLNYVGYWKWNSNTRMFEQGSNIDANNYNVKVEPLYFDAENGLPQKIRVESNSNKKFKLSNDNNDGSLEVTEDTNVQRMVKFNSKSRSITEYPYFEIEGVAPSITTPVTSNGYYKFDGNTLISGTNQDYNINVEVNNSLSINKITVGSANNDISNNNGWTYYSNSTTITISPNDPSYLDIIIRKKTDNTYFIELISGVKSSTNVLISSNSWVFHRTGIATVIRFWKDNQMICALGENNGSNEKYVMYLSQTFFNFNGISWMTFN